MAPFDFGKHVGKRGTADLTDPLALFQALDRKTSHTTLRPAQEAALRELHARRTVHDVVLKMPTGTGKSTVGLLHLRAKGAELKRAVVYLCPTVQLVKQVLEEAERLGVKAFHYASGESHPETACMSGEAVTVCTYDKLFNARTTFDRDDVYITPAAIVLDDAHAGVEQVRDAFTITIRGADLLKTLYKILDGPARTYAAGHWDDLQSGRPGAPSLEIPYWSWRTVTGDVRATLSSTADLDELRSCGRTFATCWTGAAVSSHRTASRLCP
jgi:Rad3-related DNA helicase